MPSKKVLVFAAACLLAALLIGTVTAVMVGRRPPVEGNAVVSTGQPAVGGPFQLVDQTGRAVDQSLLDGKWSLVFFGFTRCPDFCPTTLQMIEATKEQMGARGDDLQVVFITVDPERDTPAAMADYLQTASFPRGVVGLTGTPDQVAAAARAYRAFYEKVGEGDAYTMNHTLTIYLMGPDGRFRSALASSLGPDKAADVIARAMARG